MGRFGRKENRENQKAQIRKQKVRNRQFQRTKFSCLGRITSLFTQAQQISNFSGLYLTTAVDISREAGALLAQLFKRPREIFYKRPSDLVTDADRRSEALIIERLESHFPKHAIVAEEGGGTKTDSDYCWYVDPLDGTTNFAHGFPIFCVTLGLAYRGEVIAGVVYDPLREELFTAEKGAGAYLNNQRIRVSKLAKLSESLLATGFPPFASNHDLNIEYYLRFTQLTHGLRRALLRLTCARWRRDDSRVSGS